MLSHIVNMKTIKKIIFILTLLFPTLMSAQFYVTGDDPGRLKWNYIDTDNYRIIYPRGTDSLARVYGINLEKYRDQLSYSSGYQTTGGIGSKRMPVVMHAWNDANGSVAWAPKRMDLFTIPSASAPEALPWSQMLSIHEQRHVTQMQFALGGNLGWGNYVFGEMWNILWSLVYPDISAMEGDCVTMETALSKSGRGRSADFLNYFRVAFDNGDFRKSHHWYCNQQRRYIPSYYALGYIKVAGMRALYDYPEYMSDVYHLAARNPIRFDAMDKVTKDRSGKKPEKLFMEICDSLHAFWKADDLLRAPFTASEQVVQTPRLYAEYEGNCAVGNDIYAIKNSFEKPYELVKISGDGTEQVLGQFSWIASGLQYDPGKQRLYWSEKVSDERWSLETKSVVKYMDWPKGSKKTIHKGDLSFNPSSPDENGLIPVVEYFPKGGSALNLISDENGEKITGIMAPDSLQLIEPVWLDHKLYVSALSENGYGIYCLEDCEFVPVLKPQPLTIKDLNEYSGYIYFTCDLTGVNELYFLNPEDGKLYQRTVTKYGAEAFQFSEDGRWLYYSTQMPKGKLLFRSPTDSLIFREVDYSRLPTYPFVDKIVAQEKALASANRATAMHPDTVSGFNFRDTSTITFSKPKKYNKFAHMVNLHSWIPFYVSPDAIMNMSFDHIYQAVSLGAIGILQNRLGNAVGEFGYSAHKDPYEKSQWRHSAHIKFTYSGLYPVIEASLDVNDRAARAYFVQKVYSGDTGYSQIVSKASDIPAVEGKIRLYIPFSFTSEGWFRGLVPSVTYRLSNDVFSRKEYSSMDFETFQFHTFKDGPQSIRHSLSASLRGYLMTPVANSAVYPRWGFGSEIGVSANFDCMHIASPMGYAYAYAYLPGVIPVHGIKLTAMLQTKLDDKAYAFPVVNYLPRGFENDTRLLSHYCNSSGPSGRRNNNMFRLTAEYAMPIYVGNLSLGGTFFYLKRLVLTPHFDYTYINSADRFYSVGGTLAFDVSSILWLNFPFSVGVTASYNGGNGFKSLESKGIKTPSRYFVGPVFDISF